MDEYQAFQPPASVLEDAPVEGAVLAERGTRLGASLLDGVIALSVLVLGGVGAAFMFASRNGRMDSMTNWLPVVLVAGAWALVLAVWNSVWIHKYGQTIGKRILKIRVVRTSGERASLARIFFLRYVPTVALRFIPVLGAPLTLAFGLVDALLIFRENQLCLHDQIADTKVIQA